MIKLLLILGIIGFVLSLASAGFALLCLGAVVMSDAPTTAHLIYRVALPMPIVALVIEAIVVTMALRCKNRTHLTVSLFGLGIAIITVLWVNIGIEENAGQFNEISQSKI